MSRHQTVAGLRSAGIGQHRRAPEPASKEYSCHFKFLICAPAFDPTALEGQRIQTIVEEIKCDCHMVIRARTVEDAELVLQADVAVGYVLLDWGKRGPQGKMDCLVSLIRKRGLDAPIVILFCCQRLKDIPVDVLQKAGRYMFLAEETRDFIAKNVISRPKRFAKTLRTPSFGALITYVEQGNQLWTCPGHNGGVFHARSPIGRIFVQHLGKAVFRDDPDNYVLVHEGPALATQEAAKILSTEQTWSC
jgi:ornithine decarboxylase